jgi:hypothetical protein
MFWRKLASVLVPVLLLMTGSLGSAFEVSSTLLRAGKYPPGDIYKTDDLPKLVGKELKVAYLVGDFLYVGKVDGKDSFASFTTPPLRLGNTAVIISFHHNFPPTLVPGRAIKADKRQPIALLSVKRTSDGKIIAFGEDIFEPRLGAGHQTAATGKTGAS